MYWFLRVELHVQSYVITKTQCKDTNTTSNIKRDGFYKLLHQTHFFNLMQHIRGDWRVLFTAYAH